MSLRPDEFLLPQPDLEHLCENVLCWLASVPHPFISTKGTVDQDLTLASTKEPYPPPAHAVGILRPSKRRASRLLSRSGPISPPATVVDGSQLSSSMVDAPGGGPRTPSPSKKRKTDSGPPDPEATPRVTDPPVRFGRAQSSRTTQSDTSSQTSGRSSPTKQMTSLSVRDDGLVTRTLSYGEKGLPAELADMVTLLKKINNGFGIISQTQQDVVEFEAARNPDFQPLHPVMFAEASKRDAVGPTPTIDDVKAILSWAKHSDKIRAGEAPWNTDVHAKVLNLAIHGGTYHNHQLLDVANCTSANIIDFYLPQGAKSKKVDFCIVLDPQHDNDATAAVKIDNIRRWMPEFSINHCAQESLEWRPIAVSIETKRDGDRMREAQLQIGTWHTAQWNALSHLLRAGRGGHPTETGHDDDEGDVAEDNDVLPQGEPVEPGSGRSVVEIPDPARRALKALPYLPAVVVHGHDWYFAATSREGQKTVLWRECPFGSTRDALEIYKIVCGLQVIARYSEDTFWPWYKAAILSC